MSRTHGAKVSDGEYLFIISDASDFNPAAIIMSRQLPLFLAELQVLEGANGASSDVFSLYEVTSRVLALRDELCPETEHGFDVDAFFEPHIVMWLRETEANETHQWVTRSVAMDSVGTGVGDSDHSGFQRVTCGTASRSPNCSSSSVAPRRLSVICR